MRVQLKYFPNCCCGYNSKAGCVQERFLIVILWYVILLGNRWTRANINFRKIWTTVATPSFAIYEKSIVIIARCFEQNNFDRLGRFHRVKRFTDLVEASTKTARLLLKQ